MTPPDESTGSIFTNPYITGIIGAALTQGANLVASFLNRQPNIQDQINKSFAELRESYRETFDDMSKTIADLRDEVSELNDHVLDLTATLEKHGISPPPRQRKSKAAN